MKKWIVENIPYQKNAMETLAMALRKYPDFLNAGHIVSIQFYIREFATILFNKETEIQNQYKTASHLLRAFVSHNGGRERNTKMMEEMDAFRIKLIKENNQ